MLDVNTRMAIDTVLQAISSIDFYNRYGEKGSSEAAIVNQLEFLKVTVTNMIKTGEYEENDILRFKMVYQHLKYLYEGVQDKRSDSID